MQILIAPPTPLVQQALLETSFDIQRIIQRLAHLRVVLPLRSEVAEHILHLGTDAHLEHSIDGTILNVIDDLEPLAERLAQAARETEVDLRRKEMLRRSKG